MPPITRVTKAAEGVQVRERKRPDLTAGDIESFIHGHEWRFAKSMAHIPHAYVVKAKCRCPFEFQRFVIHIRKFGYRAKFGRTYYTYFDWMVDGTLYQFWTMGAPLEKTIIINRAVKGMNS
jgi:hypothetical protein